MPKTSQAKLDYIKRYNQKKVDELKENGTYRGPGRPKSANPKTPEQIREYNRKASEKHNAIAKKQRAIAKQQRIERKLERLAIIDRIKKVVPYEDLSKISQVIDDLNDNVEQRDAPSGGSQSLCDVAKQQGEQEKTIDVQ